MLGELRKMRCFSGRATVKRSKDQFRSCGKGLKMTKHLQISLVVVALVG